MFNSFPYNSEQGPQVNMFLIIRQEVPSLDAHANGKAHRGPTKLRSPCEEQLIDWSDRLGHHILLHTFKISGSFRPSCYMSN